MSDSRLEKFIYAICSMDVSDLPVPLSRIEKLWNCLITGETPDFEPLSRNEKYLMAMLDRYDISNLPAPMSRGEKLLYKIAVGETDLSDVPGYLSRYEELLKYLIENGGIGFEYVLYTLNQSLSTLYSTAEKPVKSAILKGQTLVNLSTVSTLTSTVNNISVYDLKDKCKYLFKCDVSNPNGCQLNINFNFTDGTSGYDDVFVEPTFTKGSILKIFNFDFVDKIIKNFNLYIANNDGITLTNIQLIEYQEGMENWDIPYFEGMQSVKMPVLTTTGKNLLNPSWDKGYNSFYPFNIKKGSALTLSTKDSVPSLGGNIRLKDVNDEIVWLSMNEGATERTVYLQTDIYQINNTLVGDIEYQLELGSTVTEYEPYKTNILSTSEDVTLRGIGDVQDTLDGLTGEVTERIGEIMLNESLNYQGSSSANGENTMYFQLDLGAYPNSIPVSSHFKVSSANLYVSTNDYEGIRITGSGSLQLRVLKSKLNSLDVKGLKEYLKQNNISLQYRLATESVKTVDLTTVDQDGQPTKLKTFNDISYVDINSDNIIPSVDVEVATKINETLATLDPQQLDISETQNKLGQTINEQTENTDATMMATTEIYEQTL